MRYGFVNHPARPVAAELAAGAAAGFDYVDFTLEHPRASRDVLEPAALAAALGDHGLGLVGHTAFYYPLDLPWPDLRQAVAREVTRDLEFFAAAGADRMTLHLIANVPLRMFHADEMFSFWTDTLAPVAEAGRRRGVRVMLENCPPLQSSPLFGRIMERFPEFGFHLDVGHANLSPAGNQTAALLEKFGPRLAHVHLSDNLGGTQDLHLPIGTGAIDWPASLKAILAAGWDDTMTLEVFSAERAYLALSLSVVKRLVAELSPSG